MTSIWGEPSAGRGQHPRGIVRSIVFWLHLATGLTVGSVVFIMSATGAMLAFQRPIQHWADVHAYRAAPPADDQTLPMGAIVANAQAADPGDALMTVAWRSDPAEPIAVTLGARTFYVNPYDGRVYGGGGGAGWRTFFTAVNGLHRWLGMADANRAIGRDITAACNLGFLVLILTGPYLWWPRHWTWANLTRGLWLRRGLATKARYFNWHHVVGFWSVVPLFAIVVSGVVMSYPWANALVYRAFGETPPASGRAGVAAPAGEAGGGAGGGTGRPREERPARANDQATDSRGSRAGAINLDALAARAAGQVEGWQIITVRMPAGGRGPVTATIDRGDGGQPSLRDTLTLDARTAAVVRWEPFSSQTPGRRARSWLRFIHTGEAFGTIGEVVAATAASGVTLLVFTGVSLALRRLFGRRRVVVERARTGAGRVVRSGDPLI